MWGETDIYIGMQGESSQGEGWRGEDRNISRSRMHVPVVHTGRHELLLLDMGA